MTDLEEEGIRNGQTPEEACKARIYKRLSKNSNSSTYTDDPEYKRLQDYFFGSVVK